MRSRYKIAGAFIIILILTGVSLSSLAQNNNVRIWAATAPASDPNAAVVSTSLSDVKQLTQYFDGLGRPVQIVEKQMSPLQMDIVSFNTYDSFGRESLKYLPFTSSTSDGNYKSNAQVNQSTFYQSQFPSESNFYSQTDFEPSPMNRTVKSFAPGNSWAGSRGSGSERKVQYAYLMNTASDNVQLWTCGSVAGSIPSSVGAFAAGSLDKLFTTDEKGLAQVEYKDGMGRIVLKQVQQTASPGTNHSGWLNTYFIYDDLNHLRYILQPRAVALLLQNSTWNLSAVANLLTELCFYYEYDIRGRVSVKRSPGKLPVYMVYDIRNRLVMQQDGNLRALGKWEVKEYENSQNRLWRTGLLTDGNTLAYHQSNAQNSTSYPVTSGGNYEVLCQIFYDDYSWVSGSGSGLTSTLDATYTSNTSYFLSASNSTSPYPQNIAATYQTIGLPTGSMVKVLNSSPVQYLYNINFYDDHGRTIQTQSTNITGGKDIFTTQYSWCGQALRTLLVHQKNGTNAQSHLVLTKMNYDASGRIKSTWKRIDNVSSDQLIDSIQYNELGAIRAKFLGNYLDSVVYDYNIRGWITGINKKYINSTASHFFGMELAYDKTTSVSTTSYAAAQFNGTISGEIWKSTGDGVGRKYDYKYDYSNRITEADFVQNTTGNAWDNATIDFTVRNLTYDENSNILSMSQMGFTIGGSSVIDSLAYGYQANSNKLNIVNDAKNNPTSAQGDFHYNGTKGGSDYNYDGNGNLTADNNKSISSITYNVMSLPEVLTVTGKGSVQFVYDAAGHKLKKITIDNTIIPSVTTTQIYSSGFTYQNDTLLQLGHEEGRIRWAFHKYADGSTGYGFEYDFFEKDHLGNTRIVLTQQKDTAKYIATMESAYRATESKLFYNVQASSYSRAAVSGYPTDATTNPNDSLMRLNGSGQKVGAAIILKVMSGDIVDIAVKSYYTTSTGTGTNSSLTNVLASLASGIVSMASGAKGTIGDLNNTTTSPLFGALNAFTTANNPTIASKPRAYLNWILVDEQLNYVSTYPQSGAVAVGNSVAGTLNTLGYSNIPITKSGYLYIYVNNETQGWDVFFDNLSIQHRTGPVVEETHYYPGGLTMAAISDHAMKTNYIENKFKYNAGTELDNRNFSDGTGLEMYETGFRNYDPQIGRFVQMDHLDEVSPDYSQYSFCKNNPISFTDELGLTPMGQGDFDKLWNSPNGGYWNEGSGDQFFNSQDDAFYFGASQMTQNGMWGGGSGWAGSFGEALTRYNGGAITPGLVADFYRQTWGSGATNISATSADGGFNISFTASSSGESYSGNTAMFESTGSIRILLEQVMSLYDDGSKNSHSTDMMSTIITGGSVLDKAWDLASSPSIISKNYANAVKSAGEISAMKILGKVTGAISIVDDAIKVREAYENGDVSGVIYNGVKGIATVGFLLFGGEELELAWNLGTMAIDAFTENK